MRRSSTDKNYLRFTLICLSLVVYQIMSSLYTYLPLFVGVFFAFIVINFENEKSNLYIYLSFAYLTIYDLDKGFYLFSSLLSFLIFYYLFVEKIRNFFSCTNCIVAIYVVAAYLGHSLLNSFIAYVLNQDMPSFSQGYFYYIALDVVLAIVLFKGKV
ncbi:MAG TPA: hypothetical protein EYG93_01585 [Sulfurospirillum arcachonense]|nr:hypothetical protein [Sulfurospirillum arcachonense]HIP44012.1 hypothetical protein [Sulfurospirillum arcachonense]